MLDRSINTPKYVVPPTPDHQPNNPWRQLESLPKDAWVEVLLENGWEIKRAKWAEDLSGEEQPPFRGLFERTGNYFTQIPPAKAWRKAAQPSREKEGDK